MKRTYLVLSSRKWMLSLLNCKMSIVKNLNQHYNHKLTELFKRSFTEMCLNFNIELDLWIAWFWECPFSLGGCQSYSFLLIFLFQLDFCAICLKLSNKQMLNMGLYLWCFFSSYVFKLMILLSMITRELSDQNILTQCCIPYRILRFDLHGKSNNRFSHAM